MDEFDHRTRANMDIVLEDICRAMKHGGDHESRKYVAQRLLACARAGRTGPLDLSTAASGALQELMRKKSA